MDIKAGDGLYGSVWSTVRHFLCEIRLLKSWRLEMVKIVQYFFNRFCLIPLCSEISKFHFTISNLTLCTHKSDTLCPLSMFCTHITQFPPHINMFQVWKYTKLNFLSRGPTSLNCRHIKLYYLPVPKSVATTHTHTLKSVVAYVPKFALVLNPLRACLEANTRLDTIYSITCLLQKST